MPDLAPTGRPVPPVRRVRAVLVAWHQADQLVACLDALDAQTHPDLEVIVVDNASGDGSLPLARAVARTPRRHPVTVVANTTNRGFTGGVHDGLCAPGSPWEAAWLVNVDAVPAPDHLQQLVAVLDRDPRYAGVQGRLVRTARAADGGEVVDSTGVELTTARLFRDRDEGRPAAEVERPAGEVFGITGACALLRAEALRDAAWPGEGPWAGRVLTDELFAYFDDVDLAWRLRRLGWRFGYVPTARAEHERGGAGPRRSAFVEELNAANRLLVLRTCDGRRGRHAPLVWATTALKLVDLLVSHPAAAAAAGRRWWWGRPAATRRRELLAERARRDADEVVAAWAVPFRWTPWVTAWWQRVRGRAPGVASGRS